jgi:3-hydroxybenzoate/4-hydroxybenzoate---CoA ligase
MNAVEKLLGEEALARHGERVAIICDDERVTFRALASNVQRAAGAFAALGVRTGQNVLLLMRDTPEFGAAWLGAVHAGAVAVALNNRLSDAECRHVATDSNARLAIIDDAFAATRPQFSAELGGEGRLVPLSAWREALRTARATPPAEASAETPALALYSSGTTGPPKGIVHAHRAIDCVGTSLRTLGIGAGDRVFTTSKLFFAYGLEHGLLAPLALGATAVLYPDWPDVQAVAELVTRHSPAAMFSVPTIYRRLLGESRERLTAFRGVRRFVAGGERLSTQLVAQWHAAVGGELLNLYGMSETFCACVLTPPGSSNGPRTGMPLDGVEVRLLDADGREARADDPGVLWVRHPAQASGYVNLPQQTRAHFRDGWFCSRDLFVRDAEGYLVHQGRCDELLKIAGQWVQPAELEDAALSSPAVAEAACVPVADGDGLERVALFVTARHGAEALRAAVEACERLLPRHKRPKWVRALPELPRTATGKVQRYKLREILQRELAPKE